MTIPDIPFDREAIRVGIEGLIAKYRSMQEDIRAGRLRLNEANVRSDFIDVLFQLLGWDIHDARQYDLEHYIRGEGYADIALIYEGEPKVFIEAKKFGDIRSIIGGRFIVSDSGERISTDLYSDENQVLGYAYSKGIRWSIYTNFEIFRAYNEHNRAIINIERMEEYPTRIDDLLYLTRDAVISGRINELQTREERPDIDLEFLNQMKKWRLSLAESVYTSNLSLFNLADVQPEERKAKLEEINRIAQRILDRLIIIRFAEDKLVIPPDQLKARNDAWKLTRRYSSIWNDVKEFFNRFNDRHDSKIFERGHSSERVNIPDDIISRIIDDLYRICFRRFTSDILGNTYEMYLGYKLVVVEGRIQFEEDPEHLRDEGIYYTPSYIVEFITKEILGKRLNKIKEGIYQAINERQSPRIRELLLEVSALRILDPSCGSGSFLIKSLETLLQFYSALIPRLKEYNRAPHAMAMTLRPDEIDRLSTRVPEIENPGLKIIEENIFGIDLDETAVEIAAINVILQTLQKDMMLPNIIGQNLRMGNSLVFGDASTLAPLYGPQWAEVHPFNWETEFPDTKFEMIVGNPPYIA